MERLGQTAHVIKYPAIDAGRSKTRIARAIRD
jgi:hypothetical protein